MKLCVLKFFKLTNILESFCTLITSCVTKTLGYIDAKGHRKNVAEIARDSRMQKMKSIVLGCVRHLASSSGGFNLLKQFLSKRVVKKMAVRSNF